MLTEKWKNALDNGESVELLSTDMPKAFDYLNYRLLLEKLEVYGFDTAIQYKVDEFDILKTDLTD